MRSRTVVAAAWGVAAALLAAAPANATYPGENGRIYFTANAVEGGLAVGVPDVWSVNSDGSGLVNLTDLPGGPTEGYDSSAAGTGSLIAFGTGSQATAEIWTMNAAGSNPRRVTNDQLLDQRPALSPDGSRIVFSSYRDYPTYIVRDIWSMGFDGSGQVALVDSTLQEFSPAFTPDGKTIALAYETGGTNFDISTTPSSGGPFDTVTRITTAATEEVDPSVSPDGNRVAFSRWPDGFPIGSKPDVFSANLTGGDEHPIATDPNVHESQPAYSPDGTKIVYVTDAGDGTLVIADVNGSNPKPIPIDADIAVFESNPDWAVKETLPVDPTPPADTVPPETKITKAPPNNSAKPKAKYKFASSDPDSTFECKLKGKGLKNAVKQFGACDSPRKYKRLDEGKFKFQVRAIDAAGNVDPTPAKDKFKVVG
jgi:Tol biopolymer transport system component